MRLWVGLAFLAALAGCGEPQPDAGLNEKVSEAWVRLPAAEGRPGAAYFRLSGVEGGDVLLAVDSPEVATVELHETVEVAGAMSMEPLESVEVPSGEVVLFEPGGKHAMLFGIREDAGPGAEISLNFRFDSGRDIQARAHVVGPGDPSPFGEPGE